MANALTAVKTAFASDAARGAYNAVLAAQGLPTLGERPLLRGRHLLRRAAALPALAIEIGEVVTADVGSGGLRAMRGVATLWLAFGRADDDGLLERLEPLADALRVAVEQHLAGEFQRLTFAGCDLEGVAWREGPVPLRLLPVRFAFEWLYETGEL